MKSLCFALGLAVVFFFLSEINSSSGVLIGGYDPVILTNNLFRLLQDEDLIDQGQAEEIKSVVENEKGGASFGGVNVLKFNKVVLNILINNGIIYQDEAQNVLNKAKEAGGVKVNGYNVIVLEVEIVNLLVNKGHLKKEAAQQAVDTAKP